MNTNQNEILVAIINNISDFNIAKHHHWYRIPVKNVEKWLKKRWPPRWLAFYQTKVFGDEKWSINYFAEVFDIQKASRVQLFPNEPANEKSEKVYFQIFIGPLQRLPTLDLEPWTLNLGP